MTYEAKLEKIGYATLAGRLIMCCGCGLFVRQVTKVLTKDANFIKKTAILSGAVCTAWAIGHAVDCYWDGAAKKLVDSAKWSETFNNSEEEETEKGNGA